MCGIVGAVAQRDVAPILLLGLQRLEYRGYDSAGMACIDAGKLQLQRVLGKVAALQQLQHEYPLAGGTGIAHTRWATHGVPCERNAHPHRSGHLVVVHNGIIENYLPLKLQLQQQGYEFQSDTDSEVIAHLIHQQRELGFSLLEAVQHSCQLLTGAYGMAVIDEQQSGQLVVARKGSPLVIGVGIGEHFIASDALALLPVTRRFIYLEEGDIAQLSRESVQIYAQGQPVERPVVENVLQQDAADKGAYRHYMRKEIDEQPQVVRQTLNGRLSGNGVSASLFNPQQQQLLAQVQHVQLLACGTSYHAALVARYWLEQYAQVSCSVEIASEYRYRQVVVPANSLLVTLSQSGETADTLAALRLAKQQGYLATLTICNTPGSSLVRESDWVLMTCAGQEIGVASTKAFTSQLTALWLLVATLAQRLPTSAELAARLQQALLTLPELMQQVLTLSEQIESWAAQFLHKQHALFLGRGELYPIALEGALKLKEISYIHAEAYAAGELKHGPLALIDEEMPVVVVAANNQLVAKLAANLEEVKARGGQLYLFIDQAIDWPAQDNVQLIRLPSCDELLSPILYTLPLQLLAYHVAVIKGTDVDQPRNLAKSVTVE